MVVSLGPPRVNTDSAREFRFFDLGRGQYFMWTEFWAERHEWNSAGPISLIAEPRRCPACRGWFDPMRDETPTSSEHRERSST